MKATPCPFLSQFILFFTQSFSDLCHCRERKERPRSLRRLDKMLNGVFLNFQLVKFAVTAPPANTTECTLAMGAVASTRGRVADRNPGCVRARDIVRLTRAVVTTVRPADLRNVSR